jgi:curved DNA-binding protein
MAERDFYTILGVPRTATEAEIRKAYKNLARKYHPDRNQGDKKAEEKFKDISHASDVLLNKKKRQLYDEFGEIGLKEGFNPDTYRQYRSAASGAASGSAGFRDLSDLEELLGGLRGAAGGRGAGGFGGFQDFMGGEAVQELFRRGRAQSPSSSSRPPPQRSELVSEITLEFVEALRGGEREILLSIPGETDPRMLKVRFPAGIKDGGQIRLRGQGINGGDVVLKVHVTEHAYFKVEGDDLLLQLPVTIGEAYRGGKIPVPTPAGEVSLTLPKGAKSGAKLRLRGKGIPRGDTAGDLIVTILIRLPEAQNEELDRVTAEIDKFYKENPRAGIKL